MAKMSTYTVGLLVGIGFLVVSVMGAGTTIVLTDVPDCSFIDCAAVNGSEFPVNMFSSNVQQAFETCASMSMFDPAECQTMAEYAFSMVRSTVTGGKCVRDKDFSTTAALSSVLLRTNEVSTRRTVTLQESDVVSRYNPRTGDWGCGVSCDPGLGPFPTCFFIVTAYTGNLPGCEIQRMTTCCGQYGINPSNCWASRWF